MSDYSKFVILSSPRCGTHMMREGLDYHPNIVCHTEMFNPDYVNTAELETETSVRLSDSIYHEYPKGIRTVGFCLHRNGANVGSWGDIFDMIQSDKSIKIISLYRKNLLKRFFSVKLQLLSKEEILALEPFLIDADDLIEDFKSQSELLSQSEILFSDHQVLSVAYEDMVYGYDSSIRQVLKFLLPQKPISLHTFKFIFKHYTPISERRSYPSMERLIKNYDHLKHSLKNTEWSVFFED